MGIKVGTKVMCNGYEGVVSKICGWDDMIEVRLDRGVCCVGMDSVEVIA